jgi:hypothetical protein
MLATKTFLGQRLDLQHYKNVVMNKAIEVFTDAGEPYEIGVEDVIFEFFAKPHGKSLEEFNLGQSTDNLIDFDGHVLDYRPSIYYHECYQMTDASPSEKILLFYGVSEIL